MNRALPLIFVVCLIGCGGDEPDTPETFAEACALVAGCETPINAVSGPRQAIWRVLAIREAGGGYRIEAVEEVEVAQAIGTPQGHISGQVLLASLDASGTPMEVQYLRFPDVLEIESFEVFDARVIEDMSGMDVDAVGFLEVSGDVETLALADGSGTILASLPAPVPGEAVGGTGAAREALVQAAPASACAHVMLIENDFDQAWYREHLEYSLPLQTPSAMQRALVASALGRMTPIHCAGISRVAFADFGGGDLRGTAGMVVGGFGDLVIINSFAEGAGGFQIYTESALTDPHWQTHLQQTFFHEGAHATERLLNFVIGADAITGVGEWAPSERRFAGDAVVNARLRGGFGNRWLEVHESFRSQGWAGDYLLPPSGNGTPEDAAKASIRALSPAELAEFGMLSQYATKFYGDDIADTVAWAIAAPLMREAGVPSGPAPDVADYGCVAMREHAERSVPQALSVVFTKLAFARDIGILSDEDFESCAGTSIGLPVDSEGIDIYQDGMLQRRFAQDPSGTIGTLDDRYVFELTVGGRAEFSGTEYPGTLRLVLDLGPTSDASGPIPVERISWPRGLFSLAPGAGNRFELRLPDARAGDFDVYDGFVLVTEATNDRIVGSVVVREALRVNAPVPVPQVFDPPTQFRFLLQN